MHPPTPSHLSRLARPALALLLTLVAAPGVRADDEVVEFVIPPGQDEAVAETLGRGVTLGDCAFGSGQVLHDRIEATYECEEAGTIRVRLVHPGAADEPAVRTEKFWVVPVEGEPDDAFLEAFEAHLEAHGAVRWEKSSEAPQGLEPARDDAPAAEDEERPEAAVDDAPDDDLPRARPQTPDEQRRYEEALELYRHDKHAEAFAIVRKLAEEGPAEHVLGMVVATLAAGPNSREYAARLGAEADANPDDPLPQFLAGVAWHYFGHEEGQDEAEKAEAYRNAIRYLRRARPDYDFEPRLYIYLAVSNFRLGNQERAEALIDRGIALGDQDPDAYYCRAEILQRRDIEQALEDIDRYLTMMKEREAEGAVTSQAKRQRVIAMKEHLEAVQRGDSDLREVFDPAKVRQRTIAWAALAGTFLLVMLGAAIIWWRRR